MTALARVHHAKIPSRQIADVAAGCLKDEIATYPKPGLVSHVDSGAHADMDAALLRSSADTLRPFFAALALAGGSGQPMGRLRMIGIDAEAAMLTTTRGVNTHRGAIFGMGLLCAAAGYRARTGATATLGAIVRERWGSDIGRGPVTLHSHGTMTALRFGAGGARAEAEAGFPSVYRIGLPALDQARALGPENPEAVRVQVAMALIAKVEDTNILYRAGSNGLMVAQALATDFLARGGIGRDAWLAAAIAVHRQFVDRRISPGGCADLLAMTLFVDRMGA